MDRLDRDAKPAAILRSLADVTDRIEVVGKRLSAAKLKAPPEPGAWSPNEILWHIRATADEYGEHVARILDEDKPRWRHVSPRARMKKVHYNELPFAESFAAFKQQRADLIALLKKLPPKAWERLALVHVPYNNSEWRLTIHERVRGMAAHEQGHCTQMEETAAALSKSAKR
jgi:hypothetical protein